MKNVWEDMGIDDSDWQSDPKEFAKRVRIKAESFKAMLSSAGSIADMESTFKKVALNNTEAQKAAQEFINNLQLQLAALDPQVLVNVLPLMPTVTKDMHALVRTSSMRVTNNGGYSRTRLLAMYNTLRQCYATYSDYQKLFNDLEFPVIPALKGNFNDRSDVAVREYVFEIDGANYLNYYTVARILGIECTNYMDVVDAISEAYDDEEDMSTINGHNVRMEELKK